jgi:hypothetical protein
VTRKIVASTHTSGIDQAQKDLESRIIIDIDYSSGSEIVKMLDRAPYPTREKNNPSVEYVSEVEDLIVIGFCTGPDPTLNDFTP